MHLLWMIGGFPGHIPLHSVSSKRIVACCSCCDLHLPVLLLLILLLLGTG
jgi:hypothetical protein